MNENLKPYAFFWGLSLMQGMALIGGTALVLALLAAWLM